MLYFYNVRKDSSIYVAGHNGMVGSAIVRLLKSLGYSNILTRSSSELDLRNQSAVNAFFAVEKPEYVFMAAAKVGGILANDTYRADFIYDNIMMEANVINAAYQNGVNKLLFLGSSCIYPKLAPQPIKEEYLLTGELETTNEPYAIAKIAGVKLCESYRKQYGCNFISVMPCNVYGTGDNYHENDSHVMASLIRKFVNAVDNKESSVTLWGDGTPRREFIHVDDLADACVFLMLNYDGETPINVGTGNDITIIELASKIASNVGYSGSIVFDESRPNGTQRKVLDVSKLHSFGWSHRIGLDEGMNITIKDYRK